MHQNRIKPRQNMVKSIGSCYDSGTANGYLFIDNHRLGNNYINNTFNPFTHL